MRVHAALGLLAGCGALSGCQSGGGAAAPRTVTLRGENRGRQAEAEQLRRAGKFDEAIDLYDDMLAEPSRGWKWDITLRDGLAETHWARAGRIGGQAATAETREADRVAAVRFAREALDVSLREDAAGGAELVVDLAGTLGTYLVETGQIDEAIAHYERLLEGGLAAVTKDRIRALHALGAAFYTRAGRRGQAPATADTYREDQDRAMAAQESALRAAASIEGIAPTVIAAIHNALALIHTDRFASDQAIAEYTAAVQTLEQAGDTQSLARALRNLITELAEAGRMDQVRLRYEQLEALPHAQSDPQICAALGMADLKRGRFAEGQNWFDIAIHLAKRDGGESDDPRFVTQVLCNAAACALEVGAFDDADRYLRDAQKRVAEGGVDERTASIVLSNRGRMYLTMERLDNAEQVLETRLSALRESQGARHPDTLAVLLDLAQLAQTRGFASEALRRGREAADGLAEVLGPDHPKAAQARLELASIQRDQGEYAEALRGAESAMAALDRSLGAEHKRSVLACLEATLIAADCRGTTEGEAAFDRLEREASRRFAAMRAQLGAEHVEVLRALVYFADVSAKTTTALEGALARYREAEDGYRALMGDGGPTVASLRLRRGRILERMDQTLEALDVYTLAVGDLDRSLSGHLIRSELLASMGDLLMARGEFDKARECWDTSVNILADLYGRDDPRVRGFEDRRRR
jgi:tetratricopeptide (TPR) repeat protein